MTADASGTELPAVVGDFKGYHLRERGRVAETLWLPFLEAQRVWEREVVCLLERLQSGLRGRAVQSRKCGIIAEAMSPMNEPIDNQHSMKNSLRLFRLDVDAQHITCEPAFVCAPWIQTTLYVQLFCARSFTIRM